MPWKPITAKEIRDRIRLLIVRAKLEIRASKRARWLVPMPASVRRKHVSQHKRLQPYWRKGQMSGWL